jgi:hypothetical protein
MIRTVSASATGFGGSLVNLFAMITCRMEMP